MPYVEVTFEVPLDKDNNPTVDGAELAAAIRAHAEKLIEDAGCTLVVSRTT